MVFIYDLIEELCFKKGVTVSKLCRDCNISRSAMSEYKSGRIKTLSTDTITKISDYFGVSVGYLLGAPVTAAKEEALKALIFGGEIIVTDEMWNELKEYAEFLKQKYAQK